MGATLRARAWEYKLRNHNQQSRRNDVAFAVAPSLQFLTPELFACLYQQICCRKYGIHWEPSLLGGENDILIACFVERLT